MLDIGVVLNRLRSEIRRHDYNYYVLGKPIISDADYDEKFKELSDLEKCYPEHFSDTSPTQKVGGMVAKDLPYEKHKIPMLSLAKATSSEALRDFVLNNKFTGHDMICSPKLDGFSLGIHYKGGKFEKAVSRGDGENGQVLSHSVRTSKTLPLEISFKGDLEVRAECLISKINFDRLNKDGKYTSARNLAVGSAKLLDSSEAAKRCLDVIVFGGFVDGVEFDNESETLEFLRDQGFRVVEYEVFSDMNDLVNYCTGYDRDQYPFYIDGMTVKAQSLSLRAELGENSREPRWAVAYKFPAQSASTILREVRWQVSRNGQLTPVAMFDSVFLDDAKIENATLHHSDFASQFRLGSKIEIIRSGQVIPKVIGTLVEGSGDNVKHPPNCPECGASVEYRQPFAYCTGGNCLSQVIEKVVHFASKDALDIQGLGDSIIEGLVRAGKVRKPADLYSLVKDDLLTLEGFADKKAENVLKAIGDSKRPSLAKFIYSLGIPYTGVNTSKTLARRYQNIASVMEAPYEDLVGADDIGDITAAAIEEFFRLEDSTVNELLNAGVIPQEENFTAGTSLAGKTFVITGKLSMPRDDMKVLIEANGGKVAGSVSTKTNYLVAGSDVGAAKTQKAAALGVVVIGEAELMAMM
ncbi:NAD-dependent DNA ligase LigA [Pelotomaculum propionicicum]|uniref:NAD-dependent DNA ligase LigA n=1 Tax=Pelotomaculum propionicicum TaxID=258475 RepID=UPI003B78F09D